MDIKVLILDKGQRAAGLDLGSLLLGFPNAFVAQTTPAHVNHFYRAVLTANDYIGPAVVVAYTACIDGHEIPEASAYAQAKLAVESRAFPLFVYDPKNGDSIRQRLDLRGNPSLHQDWTKDPATGSPVTFADYAQTEPRFAGLSKMALENAESSYLLAWRQLQEFAGLR
jgi:pyruvate/2-oxoacid:ferredoxin oxidoreductase beta subunit